MVIYHGGKTQDQREAAIEAFKTSKIYYRLKLMYLGKFDILATTDLGQRGLDVEGVKYVINFDAPKDISSFMSTELEEPVELEIKVSQSRS